MLKDHRAARFLKARGYDYVQFGSWWVGTHESDIADENHPRGVSEFTGHYLRRTIVRPLMYLLPDPTLRSRLDWDYGQCQRGDAARARRCPAASATEMPEQGL